MNFKGGMELHLIIIIWNGIKTGVWHAETVRRDELFSFYTRQSTNIAGDIPHRGLNDVVSEMAYGLYGASAIVA